MAPTDGSTSGFESLLVAARRGDERAFVELTAPQRAALHAHCYRLLGSLHDADDALQETLLRAWRGIDRFEPRAPLAAWLYRIATNVCLRMLEKRGRGRAVDAHLEPYPEHAVEELAAQSQGPEALVESREAVGLAFVAAMQLLTPKQRSVLVLRDVLDWSAREVAEMLDDSVAAVNSALQRARERLAQERSERSLARVHSPADTDAEAIVMRRFQDAWEAVDIEGIVSLLADDALMTMPPEEARVAGGPAIAAFFATVPMDGRLDRFRLLAARANGQPALVAYAPDDSGGTYSGYGFMVFALERNEIAGITGFPYRPDLFERLGLPGRIMG
ncbi:MAG TPA: RNA polymerase subunit sigma-70 [Thermoleophilaceae bacterium]|nr:RNA polymerase subunit sigma-70 [Thermoleophilaceae bacterium]